MKSWIAYVHICIVPVTSDFQRDIVVRPPSKQDFVAVYQTFVEAWRAPDKLLSHACKFVTFRYGIRPGLRLEAISTSQRRCMESGSV